MDTDNPETHNLDAEKGGGYDYDQSEAHLQAFSDKAVSTKLSSLSKGTHRLKVTMYILLSLKFSLNHLAAIKF